MNNWPLSDSERDRIRRLKKRLRKRDPLHGVVDAILENGELPSYYEQAIVEGLEMPRSRSARPLAVWAAGLVPTSAPTQRIVSVYLIDLLRRRPSDTVSCCTASACCVGAWPVLFLIPFIMASDKRINEVRELAAISMGRLGFGAATLWEALAPSKARTPAGEKAVRMAVAYGLNLIYRTGGAEAMYRPDDAGENALAVLLADEPGEAASSVLEVLRATGTGRSIRPVQRYMKRSLPPELFELASSTLQILEERRTLEHQRASLLRPAEMPADSSFLLRPTYGQGETDQDLLLRPHEEAE